MTADAEVFSCPEAELPVALRLQVSRLQALAWPGEPTDPLLPVHDPALGPRSMLLLQDGTVVASLDVLTKRLLHGGLAYTAAGLSTVVTDPDHRGAGHGTTLVTAARSAMAAAGIDVGIFTCDMDLVPFYERCGWQPLPDTVLVGGTVTDPFPSDRLGKATLGCFFSASARRHEADFVGARIELHPGEVDRLW